MTLATIFSHSELLGGVPKGRRNRWAHVLKGRVAVEAGPVLVSEQVEQGQGITLEAADFAGSQEQP